jgi:endo-1,3-1,4-beta-glycanase ExoK
MSQGMDKEKAMKRILPYTFVFLLVSLAACNASTITPTTTALPATTTQTNTPMPPTDTPVPVTPTNTLVPPPNGGLVDDLDSFNTSLFSKSDGYTNGDPFNCGWRADHINFADGIMTITLDTQGCPSDCSNRPYASGEYRTNKNYGYGLFEARFKAAKASGVMSGSFFVYTGPSDNQPWDEVDVEILGKDTTKMQTNYYTNGKGGHETMINLGFDASEAFHTYAFEWTAVSIKWYVDGILVQTENGSRGALPTHHAKIMMNLWPGIGVNDWLGTFKYTSPLDYQVDWVKYTPLP